MIKNKVQTVGSKSVGEFDEFINKTLERLSIKRSFCLIDIKYQPIVKHTSIGEMHYVFSAMIIYRCDEEDNENKETKKQTRMVEVKK